MDATQTRDYCVADKSRRFARVAQVCKGEAGEAAFLNKATGLGFDVAKPWGDSSPFDFIVCTGLRCWRVQVKTSLRYRRRLTK